MNYEHAIKIVTTWAAANAVKEDLLGTLAAMDIRTTLVDDEQARARDFLFDELAARWGK